MSKTKVSKKIVGLILRAGYVESQAFTGLLLTHTKGGFDTPAEAFIDFCENIKRICQCTNNTQLVNVLREIYDGTNDSISYEDVYEPLEKAGWNYGSLPGSGFVAEIHAFDQIGTGFCSLGITKNQDKFECNIYNIQIEDSDGEVIIPFFKFEQETEEQKLRTLLNSLTYEQKTLLDLHGKEDKLFKAAKAKK